MKIIHHPGRCTWIQYSYEPQNIKVQYPDCALPDHVSQSWFNQYYRALPADTVITFKNGKIVTVKK